MRSIRCSSRLRRAYKLASPPVGGMLLRLDMLFGDACSGLDSIKIGCAFIKTIIPHLSIPVEKKFAFWETLPRLSSPLDVLCPCGHIVRPTQSPYGGYPPPRSPLCLRLLLLTLESCCAHGKGLPPRPLTGKCFILALPALLVVLPS